MRKSGQVNGRKELWDHIPSNYFKNPLTRFEPGADLLAKVGAKAVTVDRVVKT